MLVDPSQEVRDGWAELSAQYLGIMSDCTRRAVQLEWFAKTKRGQALEVGRTLLVNLLVLRIHLEAEPV